jgi:hypothetical protein
MGNIAQVLPKYQDVISKECVSSLKTWQVSKIRSGFKRGSRGLLFTASWLCGIIALKIDWACLKTIGETGC